MMKNKKIESELQNTAIKVTGRDKMFYVIVYTIVTFFMLIVLIPLINVVASSFSAPNAVLAGKVYLWPVDFSLEGYSAVFTYKGIWMAYANTFLYTIAGTAVNILMTVLAAYPLSRRHLFCKGFFTFLFTFTMLFSGGMIPIYIQMKNLGILNTRWVMILPGAINVSNMIICRTFFVNIPHDLYEAAQIDGCDDFKYLIKMVLPLSSSVLAVLTLYYAVAHWNAYHDAFLYLRDRNLLPLQVLLREILILNTMDMENLIDDETMLAKQGMAELLKYSLIIVSCVPVLILYPFIKKFFAKGVMLGSLKG